MDKIRKLTRIEIIWTYRYTRRSKFLLDEFYKGNEKQNEQQYRNAPNIIQREKKIFELIDFNTRPKTEERVIVVMDKHIQKEHLSQPLQTNDNKFKIAVFFITG